MSYFGQGPENVFWHQIKRQQGLELRLQRLFQDIMILRRQLDAQNKSGDRDETLPLQKPETKKSLNKILTAKEERRDRLLQELRNRALMIKTPYKVIADILGETNLSTIRSRVLLAKRQLKDALKKKKFGNYSAL